MSFDDSIVLIPLTQGKFATVDRADYESIPMLRQKWCAVRHSHTFYARRKQTYLHKIIMPPFFGMEVDHIDRDGLNCRRSNLRLVTLEQQRRNCGPAKGRKFKGVRPPRTPGASWQVSVARKYLGSFPDEISAVLAYNEAAKRLYGEFAFLNVIPE